MSLEIHAVSTTVSCTVSGDNGHLSAETDTRAWGFNGGKTQFFAGDTCYVIVYKSINTEIKGSVCSSGVFSKYGGNSAEVGFNIKREGITFNSPVATISKPSSSVVIHSPTYVNCNGITHITGTINFKLTSWTPTNVDPSAIPSYAYALIEYTPLAEMWHFTGLVADSHLLTTEVHASLFGIVGAAPP